MAANTLPIVVKNPEIGFASAILSTANTAVDGTGTVTTAFTADVTNGSFVQYLKFKPAVSAAATTATAARIFINNGLTNATATNNQFFESVTLPATTEAIAAAANPVIVPLNIALPAGYKINVTIATTSANGWTCCAVGGDF